MRVNFVPSNLVFIEPDTDLRSRFRNTGHQNELLVDSKIDIRRFYSLLQTLNKEVENTIKRAQLVNDPTGFAAFAHSQAKALLSHVVYETWTRLDVWWNASPAVSSL